MRGVCYGAFVAFLAVLGFGCSDSGHPLGSTGAGGRGGAGGTSSAGGAGGNGSGGAVGGSGGGAGQGATGGTVGGSGGAAGQGGGTAGRGGTAGGQAGAGGSPPLTSCPATRPAVGTACSGALTCNYNDTCRCNVCCYSGYGCMNGSIAFLGNNDGCFQISCDAGTGDGSGTDGATSCATCDPATTYCRTMVGGIPGSTGSYSCLAFPAGCGATPSCACLPTASCSGICETGSGGILILSCAGA